MTRKRKHDQRVDSNSPDAKLLFSERDTSCRPSEWMPMAQQFLDVFGSIRDELRGIAQVSSAVQVLADNFSKLDEKVENILNKTKEELKEEFKEVVKLEMQGNIQLDNNQNESKVIYDDYAKAPDCTDASPSIRSQPQQSQPPRFRLRIISKMSPVSYKGRPLRTEDGKNVIEVEMCDGQNPIAPDHPLASVIVNLVLVDPLLFHGISKKLWSEDDFRKTLWNPGNAKLLKSDTFKLNGGRAIQPVTITQGTVRKEIMLGVMLEELGSERVREGLSNSFRVQEAKTANKHKESATNGTGKMCNPLDSREREGSATHHTTKDLPRHTGESLQQPICKIKDPRQECLPHSYDAQSIRPQAIIPTEGNGHGRTSGQQYYQQPMMTQRFLVPNYTPIVQCGQGQVNPHQYYNLPPSSFSAINPPIVGNGRSILHHSEQEIDTTYQHENNSQRKILPQLISNEAEKHVGQDGLNSHQHHNFQQRSLFPATHAEPVGQEDTFQQGQRQIMPQQTSVEAAKHGQGQPNSSQHRSLPRNIFSAMPSHTMDLDINMPYSSTSQISTRQRDSWPFLHNQNGGNGNDENFQEQFEHGQPGTEEVGNDLDKNMPYSSTSQIKAPQRDSWHFRHNQIGGNGETQMLPQPTSTQAMKHGQGDDNLHPQRSIQQKSLFSTTHAQTMGQAENIHQQYQHAQPQILRETGQGQVYSPQLILPPSSLPTINAQSLGQEDNFQQGRRQILPRNTSIETAKLDQGQLNPQNLFPAMPPHTMDLARRLNSGQNRPYCLEESASEVNPPQTLSQLPINNSSGPTKENYGSNQPMWQDSTLYLPEQNYECNENPELSMEDLGNVLLNGTT